MRQQRRRGASARDGMRRRQILHHALARPARKHRPDQMLAAKVSRHVIERLAHLIADFAQAPAAFWTSAQIRRTHFNERQMLRQSAARRLLRRNLRFDHVGDCSRQTRQRFGLCLLKRFDRQFQLLAADRDA